MMSLFLLLLESWQWNRCFIKCFLNELYLIIKIFRINFVFLLSTELLQSHQENQLFAKILETMSGGEQDFRDESTISATIFGTDISVGLSVATENRIRLNFQSRNRELLLALKTDLSTIKFCELSKSAKGHVAVPFVLIRRLDDLKCFLDSIGDEASEENCLALEQCHSYLREHISSKLP